MSTFLNIHVLQSVAPSNLNRDESGRPKTATYGGTLRHRVSSQSWKNAMRNNFRDNSVETAYRTKNIGKLIIEKMQELNPELEEEWVRERVYKVLKDLKLINKSKEPEKTDALFMISQGQVNLIAETILRAEEEGKEDKDIKKELNQSLGGSSQAIDLALFGRMVATDPNLNVEGATMVAHAISTHGIQQEFDFYTATDDMLGEDEAGAGMMGDVEFTSSTLYRYAAVNLDEFRENLGDVDDTTFVNAVQNFVNSFVNSIPSGKQNSFATPTPPGLVLVSLDGSAVSYASAFEEAVETSARGHFVPSVERLTAYIGSVDIAYGESTERVAVVAHPQVNETVSNVAETVSLRQVGERLEEWLVDENTTVATEHEG